MAKIFDVVLLSYNIMDEIFTFAKKTFSFIFLILCVAFLTCGLVALIIRLASKILDLVIVI